MIDRRATSAFGEDTTVVYLQLDGPSRRDQHKWDDLMAAAVRHLRGELRRNDAVGRYGDGILTLLRGVRADLGIGVAQRMLGALGSEPVGGDVRVAAHAIVEQVAPGERLDDAAERARNA